MKSVLISIQPCWCHIIASGEKTVEVRKTRPRIDMPFKCYIYCTKDEPMYRSGEKFWCGNDDCGNGKVIGEFMCDNINTLEYDNGVIIEQGNARQGFELSDAKIEMFDDVVRYMGKQRKAYGWHISDLVIYDEPKTLRDFYLAAYRQGNRVRPPKPLTRAPQSWCYVEEVTP